MNRILVLPLMLIGVSTFAQQTKIDTLKVSELAPVTITAIRNIYKIDSSTTVSKLPLKDLENPQVYNTISKIVLKDQVITNLNNALKNATGITRLWESTGRGGDGTEYYTMRGFAVQPTIINGVANINNGALDPANVENIEVIKGPSGALYGGNVISYGGLINVVTKKPYETFGGEIGYVTGSFGLNRVTADFNTPLNSKAFLRVNTAYHSENSFQDAGFNKSFFIAPSLKFVANEKLTFLVNTELKNSESANAPMLFFNGYSPISFANLELFEKNYTKSYSNNTLTIKNPSFGMQAQALYKINKNWNSQSILSRSVSKTDGYYHYLYDDADGDNFSRYISKRNGATIVTNIQQNFTNDQTFGKIRNRIVIGFDYIIKGIENGSTGWVANGKVSLVNQTDSGTVTTQGVDALLVGSSEAVATAKTNIVSAYISDVINFTPKLSALLSLRADKFSGRPNYYYNNDIKSQTTFSPKFGVVYQPILNKFSIFANYMNGFVNLDPVQVSDINGQNQTIKIFDPERANQWEIGAKANLYKDKISITASYYDIFVSNKLMADPTNPNNQIQGGEVKSNGFEVSIVTNPIEGLSIISGFSKNNSIVAKAASTGDFLNLGLRPEEAGPENLLNFWANYRVQSGALKNLGLGLGTNYASEQKAQNRLNVGSFILPSYTIFNAAISYNTSQYSINLKIDNLSNQKYYTGWGTISAQKTRSISLALNYKF